MKKNSGRGRSPSPSAVPEAQSKAPAGSRKAKAVPRKPAAKAVKKTDKRGAPKGKFKNPPFEPTLEQRLSVEYLTACGHTQSMIGERLGVSKDTLGRHFRIELDEGTARATARLGGVLYEGALAGDKHKMEMWFDRRGGPDWRKKSGVELSGPNGTPIEYRELSDDELEARIAARLSGNAAAGQAGS